MTPPIPSSVYFGPFLVTPQVFHLTPLSFALVNLKPLLPGHVLVSSTRRVPRLRDLTLREISDFWATVHRVSRTIERVYQADGMNVAVQDGAAAGQSVPHVHCHIIPRRLKDLDERGGSDRIYDMLDGEEGDLVAQLVERGRRERFTGPDNEERVARGEEEMNKEAEWLKEEMEKDAEPEQEVEG
ncbi:HIT domain-containing protein [Eremomyces bilateralis CBS 781.70]|uniref:Bis(5'-adenosyl)-triphosphatase n=1 Tax=Eremomyces bilateralis CBS 781.70 TaxID=1392243 RepID=A0A6G1G5S3_9PEZI|nr:HIT domain-containing protein [Eremomyces bilateralis CBS 781.70]KAF1813362.1 HIT domain-containing protein [Eremomyces bilateralis CBS 781.70]